LWNADTTRTPGPSTDWAIIAALPSGGSCTRITFGGKTAPFTGTAVEIRLRLAAGGGGSMVNMFQGTPANVLPGSGKYLVRPSFYVNKNTAFDEKEESLNSGREGRRHGGQEPIAESAGKGVGIVRAGGRGQVFHVAAQRADALTDGEAVVKVNEPGGACVVYEHVGPAKVRVDDALLRDAHLDKGVAFERRLVARMPRVLDCTGERDSVQRLVTSCQEAGGTVVLSTKNRTSKFCGLPAASHAA
jgi:hypothetical protein